MAPSIKLTYFPFKGRAEPIRLALYVGGVDFEDERINSKQTAEQKAAGKSPFLSFPTMTVDGEIFAESNAILRYAGKQAGLYPKSDKAAMKVDMVVDSLESIVTAIFKDKSKEARTKCLKETLPRYYGTIDKMYAATPGPFLLGEDMTIADIKIAPSFIDFNSGKLIDHFPAGCLDEYPHILAASKAVMSHEKVKEWYAKH